MLLQSVAIWLIDNSTLRGSVSKFWHQLCLKFCFYLSVPIILFITTINSLVRIFYSRHVKRDRLKINSKKTAFVYFTKSHKEAINNVYDLTEECCRIYISARTTKDVFLHKNEISTYYLDDDINFFDLFSNLLDSLIVFYDQRQNIVKYFLSLNGLELRLFINYILKLALSLRFKSMVNAFYSEHKNITELFLGNDTCYRAFWLIKYHKKISHTIQHGIPENRIQYYSISNYFLAWDAISLNQLIKNSNVIYKICGYPKSIKNHDLQFHINNSLLFILTELINQEEINQLKKITDILSSQKIEFKIKFHPSEKRKNMVLFKDEQVYKGNNLSEISQFRLFVIDTSFGLDLAYNSITFVPLTFDKKKSFNLYFKAMKISDFLERLLRFEINAIESEFGVTNINSHVFDLHVLNNITE